MPDDQEYQAFVDRVRAKCIEVGDCWVWQGALRKVGDQPVLQLKERRVVSVRRHLMVLKGHPMIGDRLRSAVTSCETRGCVNPDHVVMVTRSTLRKMGRAQMDQGTLLAMRKKMLDAVKRRGIPKLSAADRQAIDTSSDSCQALAERFGVCKSTISSYRAGRTWSLERAVGNPFAGLGA